MIPRDDDRHPAEMEPVKREQFNAFLKNQAWTGNHSDFDTGISFYVGGIGVWPDPGDGDALNVVGASNIRTMTSVKTDVDAHRFVDDTKIHLPPIQEQYQDEIESGLDLQDPFFVHFGTESLGGVMPAPDGVATPHVRSTESVSYEQVVWVLTQVEQVWHDVYSDGAYALTVLPDGDGR